jgi:hypothetical protein
MRHGLDGTHGEAVTLALGDVGLIGRHRARNSVQDLQRAQWKPHQVFDYDATLKQLAVGRPASNIVSLFKLPANLVFASSFE